MSSTHASPHDHQHHHHAGHSHTHGHGHGGGSTGTLLAAAFWINFAFAVVEAIGGWWTGSLALLADSVHMVNDVLSLGLAWGAFRVAQRVAGGGFTYGYARAQVITALVNAAGLFLAAGFILYESIERMLHPQPVLAGPMLLIATAGLLANGVSGGLLFTRRDESMNMRGAFLHLMGDTLGSVAAIAAAIIISLTGWTLVDPILGLLIMLPLLWSGWGLASESVGVLMERAPKDFHPGGVTEALGGIDGVAGVHDLHVWQLDEARRMASVHVVLGEGREADHHAILDAAHAILRDQFDIAHATVQVEKADWHGCENGCACDPKAPAHPRADAPK